MSQEIQEYSADKIELIKSQIAKGASDDELKLFLHLCNRTGLDPFARQIYAIQRQEWDAQQQRSVPKMTFQVSIDGFRLVAERSTKYEGQVGPYWCGKDGKWLDVWVSRDFPLASKVGVLKKGFREPLFAIAHWDEYVQSKKDGTTTKMWESKPALMLAKCAESLALRKAFPQELSGMYTPDEMGGEAKEVEAAVTPSPVIQSRAAPLDSPSPQFRTTPPMGEIPIDEQDHKRLMSVVAGAGWKNSEVAPLITTMYKKDKVSGLTRGEFNDLLNHIESNPRPVR